MDACRVCGSTVLIEVNGKVSDMFSARDINEGFTYEGYVPEGLEIGKGDYIEFTYCAQCGAIQDGFPKNPEELDEEMAEVFGEE